LQRRCGLLAAIRPSSADRVRRLGERIAADLERCARLTGPIHADLHLANALVSGGRVTLIDLDNICYGDRLHDVGRFLSALRTSSIRIHGHCHGLAAAGESFLEAYLSHTGEDVSRVRLFEAACLVTSASTGFRLQRTGWQASADDLVDEAEKVYELSRAETPARSPRAAERKDWAVRSELALDPVYMCATLQTPIQRLFEASLTDCLVQRRRESARTQRMRYSVIGRRGGVRFKTLLEGVALGRRSSKGPARRISAVISALEGARDAPVLPRPVASLPEIGLNVVETLSGISVLHALGTPDAPAVAARVARALATLHQANVILDRTSTLEDELEQVRRSIDRSLAEEPSLRERAQNIVARAEGRLPSVTDSIGPAMRRLRPDHVLVLDDRIAFAEVDDLVLTQTILDAADFLARLRLLACSDGGGVPTATAAQHFRSTYLACVGGDDGCLRALEAVALLRLTCNGADRPAGAAAWMQVLTAVESTLHDGVSVYPSELEAP
jgi:Ser/Thr protein kinase RdoA (MazF antagonist)